MVLSKSHVSDRSTHSHLQQANVHLNTIEDNSTSVLTYVDGVETSLSSMDGKLNNDASGNLKVAVSVDAAPVKVFNHVAHIAQNLNDDEVLDSFEDDTCKAMRLCGTTTGPLTVEATMTNSNAMYVHFDTIESSLASGGFSKHYEHLPKKIRVVNRSGASVSVTFQRILFK